MESFDIVPPATYFFMLPLETTSKPGFPLVYIKTTISVVTLPASFYVACNGFLFIYSFSEGTFLLRGVVIVTFKVSSLVYSSFCKMICEKTVDPQNKDAPAMCRFMILCFQEAFMLYIIPGTKNDLLLLASFAVEVLATSMPLVALKSFQGWPRLQSFQRLCVRLFAMDATNSRHFLSTSTSMPNRLTGPVSQKHVFDVKKMNGSGIDMHILMAAFETYFLANTAKIVALSAFLATYPVFMLGPNAAWYEIPGLYDVSDVGVDMARVLANATGNIVCLILGTMAVKRRFGFDLIENGMVILRRNYYVWASICITMPVFGFGTLGYYFQV